MSVLYWLAVIMGTAGILGMLIAIIGITLDEEDDKAIKNAKELAIKEVELIMKSSHLDRLKKDNKINLTKTEENKK